MDRREFLFRSKARCVGRVLSDLERTVFQKLTRQEQKAVRELIRTQIASYHRDVLDALAMEPGTQINALAVRQREVLSSGNGPADNQV